MSKPFSEIIDEVIACDLFAGAGGVSTGILQAAEALGLRVRLTAVNHWRTAVNSHALNHPAVTHICEDVETLHPRRVVPGGHLHLLAASCECTYHSNARGGGPCNEQSRSQPWQIIRWATDLRIDNIIMENVPEWVHWTALLTKPLRYKGKYYKALRPDPRIKGLYFRNFVQTLENLGYTIETKVQTCCDYGDPTKRRRLILMARLNGPVVWPEPTHGDPEEVFNHQREGLPLELHKSARKHVIDWSLQGNSVFNRKKPLSQNTIRRIEAGLVKFGGKAAEPFLVMLRGLSASHIKKSAKSVDEPIDTITAQGTHIALAEPFLLGQQSCAAPSSVDVPVPTVACAGAISLTQPCIINMKGKSLAMSVDNPVPTITAHARHLGVVETKAEPFVMQANHGEDPKKRGKTSRRVKSVDAPLPTITGDSGLAVVEPIILPQFSGASPKSVNEPLGAITTDGGPALVEPFMVPVNYGERKGQSPRTHSVDEPVPTVVGSASHAVVEPFITHCTHHGARPAHSVDKPLPAVTAAHRGEMAMVEPVLVQTDQTGSNGGCIHSVDKPLSTVVSKQNLGLVQPILCKYYGTGVAKSVDEPLDTVTTKDRFLLVIPTTGEVVAELDIRFRMLQPHELAAAHSFPKNYVFTGNKGDQTKQVGNSVPVLTAMAHAMVALKQITTHA